jgi:YegS/Rv2252/BmrU family lipid kinase
MSTDAHLLINLHSRSSRQAIGDIRHALAQNNIHIVEEHRIEPDENNEQLYKNLKEQKPVLVIIAGGDGTVSHSLQHFIDTDIEIGIIPLGTTNNFARSLNIPFDVFEASKIIARRKAKAVDMGRVNGKPFANVVGIGLSAHIARHVTDDKKRRFGRLAYALSGLTQLVKRRPFVVTMHDKDKEITLNFETYQLIVANGRYHAGKEIAKDAKVDSRELLIFALGSRQIRSFAWHMLDFYLGKRKQIVHGSYVIGTDVRITTSTEQPIEVDGEVVGTTPLSLSVIPDAIKVRY